VRVLPRLYSVLQNPEAVAARPWFDIERLVLCSVVM
jgi:hypothetical protein